MSKWFERLYDKVADEGQKPRVIECGDGQMLVVEHGARILAVDLPGVPGLNENLFFHTSSTRRTTGGDRLWIAPEVAYFWPSLEDARRDPKGTAKVPAQIDPAGYRPAAEPAEDAVELTTSMILHDKRNDAYGSITVDRAFAAIEPPEVDRQGLRVCSFSITNYLSLHPEFEPSGELYAGCWDILQVPPTGTLICPTVTEAEVRSYYDPFGERHVRVEDRCTRFLIDGKRRIKMGLLAEHTTGRMGYYRPLNEKTSTLIVRIFAPQPGEPYCDLPRDAPDEERLGGDCLQAYNDDGDAFPGTTFGEMEYHDPCVISDEGPMSRTGASVTHVFAGADEAIRRVGRKLLGVEVEGIE